MKLVNVGIEYEGVNIIDNLNVEINNLEFICIIGRSGSGKSSLLKAVLELIDYEGDISYQGHISYVPQSLAVLEHLTVEQNVELALINNDNTEIKYDYDIFGLDKFKTVYPSKLSGGQLQRVALMRALNEGGDIIALDEPLSKLDYFTKSELVDVIQQAIKGKKTCLYVTHDIDEALCLADRILVVKEECQIFENMGDEATKEIILNALK